MADNRFLSPLLTLRVTFVAITTPRRGQITFDSLPKRDDQEGRLGDTALSQKGGTTRGHCTFAEMVTERHNQLLSESIIRRSYEPALGVDFAELLARCDRRTGDV